MKVLANSSRFRELCTAKHRFSTRPIFHKLDETIRCHPHRRARPLWPLASPDSLTETEIGQNGKRFIVRSAPRPAASLALRPAGVALPPTVREASA
jgi:hypothetical protein